jgi:phosphate transport system substrate-binding protein
MRVIRFVAEVGVEDSNMVLRRTSRVWGAALAAALIVSMSLVTMVRAQDATPAPYTAPENAGDLSGKIVADGSSTVGPITEAVAEEFAGVAGGVEVEVNISGTGGGFKRFCNGETDIQDASRAINEEEMATCRAAGINYYVFEVAYDGISIVVNPENDFVSCLTVDQLKKLWQADAPASTWAELDRSFPGDTVNLYGPGTDSGTYDYFVEEIIGERSSRTDYTPSEDDNVLVEGVAGDSNALGFFGFAYYEQNQDRLKLVGVDSGSGCVEPSTESIRDGSYAPLSRPLYVYVKAESLTRPEVQEFMRFYLANAPALAEDVGYVDSPIDTYVSDQAKLEAEIAGTGTPDGPGEAPAAEASPEA